jgi:hypothetical protein
MATFWVRLAQSLNLPLPRSIREALEKPERSSVSRPAASQIAMTGPVLTVKSKGVRPAFELKP